MNVFLYDNTFEGLLTTIFEIFRLKTEVRLIANIKNYQTTLTDTYIKITTDTEKSSRVWKSIANKTSPKTAEMLFHAYLSESEKIEIFIYEFIKLVICSNYDISVNYRENCVLHLKQMQRKVLKEAHRIFMFVRFQHTNSQIYFSLVQPVYDIIPLIGKHFKRRFNDQQWLIYDTIRDYGLFYDLKEVNTVKLQQTNYSKSSGKLNASLLQEKEETYQILWKNYYDSINIKERKNLKVQMQFMPKRFWNYLPEINNNI